jgi:histone acetyltransferase
VPGVKEAGWCEASYVEGSMADQRSFEDQCYEVVNFLVNHENSWPFRKPVDTKKVHDYTEVITHPMDLETIAKKVERRKVEEPAELPPYKNMDEFKADLKLMFENARIYNQAETIYYKYAWQLESLV